MWTRHLASHPLNEDKRLHLLVAKIYVLLVQWASGGKTTTDIYTTAPWLRPPGYEEMLKKRAEASLNMVYSNVYHGLGLFEMNLAPED